MRRKPRAVTKSHRKASFSKTEMKRAVKTVQSLDLPVRQIDMHPDGGWSIVVGQSSNADDPINEQQLKELI